MFTKQRKISSNEKQLSSSSSRIYSLQYSDLTVTRRGGKLALSPSPLPHLAIFIVEISSHYQGKREYPHIFSYVTSHNGDVFCTLHGLKIVVCCDFSLAENPWIGWEFEAWLARRITTIAKQIVQNSEVTSSICVLHCSSPCFEKTAEKYELSSLRKCSSQEWRFWFSWGYFNSHRLKSSFKLTLFPTSIFHQFFIEFFLKTIRHN